MLNFFFVPIRYCFIRKKYGSKEFNMANRLEYECNSCMEATPSDADLRKCSNCTGGCAKYCSRDCQAHDWPIHKIFCSIPLAATVSVYQTDSVANNDTGTVQALLLPQDSKVPILVRVQVGTNFAGVNASEFIPGSLGSEIKCHASETWPPQIFNNEDFEMYCGFALYYNTDDSVTGLPMNKCIDHVMKGRAKAYFGSGPAFKRLGKDFWKSMMDKLKIWKGPLLLVKSDRYQKNGLPIPTYEDLDVSDVPYFVNFLWVLSARLGQAEGVSRRR